MPVCHKCGAMQATAEMRRSTTPGLWVCKEQGACKRRRVENKQREMAARKGKS